MSLSQQPPRPIDLHSASDEDYALLHALENRLRAERLPGDPPVPLEEQMRSWQGISSSVEVFDHLILGDDGTVALASGSISFPRTGENAPVASIGIGVLPEYRRRGLARRLLAPIVAVARREGRHLLLASTNARVPEGEAFMRRLGAEVGQRGHLNQLDLADLDRGLLARWLAAGPTRAAGCDLGLWSGDYPEEELPALAALHDLLNDAPRDNLAVEVRHVTPEQLRELERANRAIGTERWTVYARERATGALAGFTEVFWRPSRPETLSQGVTGVLPAYRGRGLGHWLKAAMLDTILRERPAVRAIRTSNADTNAAMLTINRALGFKPFDAEIFWQVPTDAVQRYLDDTP